MQAPTQRLKQFRQADSLPRHNHQQGAKVTVLVILLAGEPKHSWELLKFPVCPCCVQRTVAELGARHCLLRGPNSVSLSGDPSKLQL